MRRILFFTIAVIYFSGLISCNHSSKKEDKQAGGAIPEYKKQKDYRRLVGEIDNNKIILHLINYHTAGSYSADSNELVYSGMLVSKGNNHPPMIVSGYIGKDSTLQLVTYDQFTAMDTLSGHFSGNMFQGKVTNRKGASRSLKLKESYPDGSYHLGVTTYKDSLSADTSLSKDYYATTDLMTLWPQADMDSALQELIKDTISQSFFGAHQSFASSQKLLQSVSDSFHSNYQNAVAQLLKNQKELRPSFNWTLLAYMNITFNSDGKISLLFTRYQFTGGAHGLQTEFGYTVNLKTGKPITLSDIFKPDYQKVLQQKLEQKFREEYNIPASEPLNGKKGLLFDKDLKLSSNFYLTPYGIGFIYNPYEVAPYVVGVINLYLPFNELGKILK